MKRGRRKLSGRKFKQKILLAGPKILVSIFERNLLIWRSDSCKFPTKTPSNEIDLDAMD